MYYYVNNQRLGQQCKEIANNFQVKLPKPAQKSPKTSRTIVVDFMLDVAKTLMPI